MIKMGEHPAKIVFLRNFMEFQGNHTHTHTHTLTIACGKKLFVTKLFARLSTDFTSIFCALRLFKFNLKICHGNIKVCVSVSSVYKPG